MLFKDFEKLLLEAVDEALSSLGETSKRESYSQLEGSFGIRREEISYKIEAFAAAIREIFGADADELEILILKRLREKIGGVFDLDRLRAFAFVENLRRTCGQLYEDFVNKMQSGVAVFHLENASGLDSFRLIAINLAAAKITGTAREEVLGKTVNDLYPEIRGTEILRVLSEVIRSGKARELGEFRFQRGSVPETLSVGVFPLPSSCVGMAFRSVFERRTVEEKHRENKSRDGDVELGMGEWRWESDTVGHQIHSDRSRARQRWMRKNLRGEPSDAEFFSIRGKECLESLDFLQAREFFIRAEKLHHELGNIEEAFANASMRIRTYVLEERTRYVEYFDVADEYFQRYADFFMHESFVENLANYCQRKGYTNSEERKFDHARRFYSEAEEIFLTLKQKSKAIFDASRFVLTYKDEDKKEDYVNSAPRFFEKYKEYSGNDLYKEVLAHHYSYKANESTEPSKAIELRSEAEKLFLEINQRELAFKNACRRIDLIWDALVSEDEESIRRCFDATERFFEKYQDFSEHEYFRKRLAEYYLFQARALASQLKQVLR